MWLIQVIFLLLVFTTFLPYNVDRPARRVPYVTYGLMAANILIFGWTLLIANAYLTGDQIQARREIDVVLQQRKDELKPDDRQFLRDLQEFNTARETTGYTATEEDRELLEQIAQKRQKLAMQLAAEDADTALGYEQFWRIQHADASIAWEPHYSALNLFAYRASEQSLWRKILGLFGSMFLHGSVMHLLGNMLFLWVFGRAVEEALGSEFALGAYIVCGLAATMLYHFVTMTFMSGSAGVPLVGASGAIAGVLGLFALRFYRTPVRIFYIAPTTLPIIFLGTLLSGALLSIFVGGLLGSILGFLAIAAALAVFGRTWAWGSFRLASMWTIGVWVVAFNLVPAVAELFSPEKGGVAYWAHIGGFGCGMVYAALIGFRGEGAREYLLEDAEKELAKGDAGKAITHARKLLPREGENAAAHAVLARAFDCQNLNEPATENYERAITLYLRDGQRAPAVTLYREALLRHPHFILPPAQHFALASQMEKDGDWQGAAENFYKIPYTYPEAPEGETSLLRAAQIYGKHLRRPDIVLQLTSTFLQRYSHSPWREQAERIHAAAQRLIVEPQQL